MAARLAALVSVLPLAGCGGEKSLTTPVQGTVTCKGKPLTAGVISFHPIKIDSSLPNRTAQGSIDASGHYLLSTFKLDDGAVPGDYAVTISSPKALEPIDEFSKSPASPSGPDIPAIYSDASITPLKATVPAGPAQQIDFDLKEK